MRYFAPLLIFLVVALGAPAAAQPFGNGGQQMQSLDSILSNIRRQHPGQLSDVQGPNNGRYLIKWLTPDGRVLWLDTDARTGQILGVRGGGGEGGNFQRQNFDPSPALFPRDERFERQPGNRAFRQDR